MAIIRRVMDGARHKTQLSTRLLDGSHSERRLIGDAVLGNHVDVVKYMLDQEGIEPHLQYRDSRGRNVLHLAGRFWNPAMFRLLVPRVKDGVQQTDDQNQTPLIRVIVSSRARQDQYESARILLSDGWYGKDGRFGDEMVEAQRIATTIGDWDMCRLLIHLGKMDPLSVTR